MLPDIYEVPGYILGALEARLIIKTENGKVTQVAARQTKDARYSSSFKEVYLSIVEELGLPDEALGTDIYRNRAFVPISPDSVLEHPTEIKARWYLEDRILEFGEPVYGNFPMYWYLAVYTDELDRFSIYGYDRANDCCPHDAGTYYDPWGSIRTRSFLRQMRKPSWKDMAPRKPISIWPKAPVMANTLSFSLHKGWPGGHGGAGIPGIFRSYCAL